MKSDNPTQPNQKALIDFATDPKTIGKAVEGSMEKRVQVSYATDRDAPSTNTIGEVLQKVRNMGFYNPSLFCTEIHEDAMTIKESKQRISELIDEIVGTKLNHEQVKRKKKLMG